MDKTELNNNSNNDNDIKLLVETTLFLYSVGFLYNALVELGENGLVCENTVTVKTYDMASVMHLADLSHQEYASLVEKLQARFAEEIAQEKSKGETLPGVDINNE